MNFLLPFHMSTKAVFLLGLLAFAGSANTWVQKSQKKKLYTQVEKEIITTCVYTVAKKDVERSFVSHKVRFFFCTTSHTKRLWVYITVPFMTTYFYCWAYLPMPIRCISFIWACPKNLISKLPVLKCTCKSPSAAMKKTLRDIGSDEY